MARENRPADTVPALSSPPAVTGARPAPGRRSPPRPSRSPGTPTGPQMPVTRAATTLVLTRRALSTPAASGWATTPQGAAAGRATATPEPATGTPAPQTDST